MSWCLSVLMCLKVRSPKRGRSRFNAGAGQQAGLSWAKIVIMYTACHTFVTHFYESHFHYFSYNIQHVEGKKIM